MPDVLKKWRNSMDKLFIMNYSLSFNNNKEWDLPVSILWTFLNNVKLQRNFLQKESKLG